MISFRPHSRLLDALYRSLRLRASRPFFLALALFLVHPALCFSQQEMQDRDRQDSFVTPGKPEIFVRWTDRKITIDGKLNEEAWKDAEPY